MVFIKYNRLQILKLLNLTRILVDCTWEANPFSLYFVSEIFYIITYCISLYLIPVSIFI